MILLTEIQEVDELWLMSGVLADPITEEEFKTGVHTMYLTSKTVTEIVCEKPRSVAGVGTTKDGLVVAQFETDQFGIRDFIRRSSLTSAFLDIGENRIQLVTSADLTGLSLPAILAQQPVNPVSVRAQVQLAVRRVADLAEVKAFVVRNPGAIDDPQIAAPIGRGMTLPIALESDEGGSAGVVEFVQRISLNMAEVMLRFGNHPKALRSGVVLQRTLTIIDPANRNRRLRFGSKLGTIERLLNMEE